MNIIFSITTAGTVTGFEFPSLDLATKIFNQDYDHKEAFRFLLMHSKSNPRNISPYSMSQIIKAVGIPGVHVDTTTSELDSFILQHLDKVWKIHESKSEANTRIYIKNTIACYPTFLERSVGYPVVLLTQDDNIEVLKDSDECSNFGDTFTGYFKNKVTGNRYLFKKIKQLCYNKVHGIEESPAEAV